jgi:photosystem II stability/assembly factor-like uncharacterized protein
VGNDIIAGTHGDGIYKTTDNGNVWTKLGSNTLLSNSRIFGLASLNNILLVGTAYNGLFRSTDNGSTWAHITSGFPAGDFFVFSVAVIGSNMIAGTNEGIFYSTNNGLSWNASNITQWTVFAVAANSTIAFAGISSGIGSTTGVYRSTNLGVSWQITSLSNGAFDIVCITTNGSTVFAGDLTNGLFRSIDNGVNWTFSASGIPANTGVFTIGVSNNTVFAGTQESAGGIFRSTNNGSNWTLINQGLVSTAVQAVCANNSNLFIGTFLNAVWRRPLNEVLGVTLVSNEIPERFSLEQNYPNPFNPATRINFSVPFGKNVTIKIYDVLGRLIKILVNEFKNSGYYSVDFDGSDLPSGIYIYKIEAGDFADSRKMILIK